MIPNKRVKKLCRQYTADWLELLGVDEWFAVVLKFIDGPAEGDKVDDAAAMICEGKWEYRFCKIRVYLPNVCNHTDRDLEEAIVHEICHGLLQSMEEHCPDKYLREREYAVETMAQALLFMKYREHRYIS